MKTATSGVNPQVSFWFFDNGGGRIRSNLGTLPQAGSLLKCNRSIVRSKLDLMHIGYGAFNFRVFENIHAAEKCKGKFQKSSGTSMNDGWTIISAISSDRRRD